jgi:hypothetical protein
MGKSSVDEQNAAPLGVGGWIAVTAMVIVLGAAVWFLFYGWNLTNAQMSTDGEILLVLGIVFTTAPADGAPLLVKPQRL